MFPVCVAAVEEPQIPLTLFLKDCIGQASTESSRPRLGQLEEWLLLYGT